MEDIPGDLAAESMRQIMSGEATDAQIGAFLTALRMKGETPDEITALATVMRKFCTRINPKVNGRLVDTCGTGGDNADTFNISTTAAIVTAGAGVPIAKHGNRSVTSSCGSADLLERLGLNLKMSPGQVEKSIEQVGVGFMFAPTFHPAMKYAIKPRRELGLRTVFNILGPLTNPAGAEAQLLGVFDKVLTESMAECLNGLGCTEAMVVHGLDGLDEISTTGPTAISHLKDGAVKTYRVTPEEMGVQRAQPTEIGGSGPEGSAEMTFRILCGLEGHSTRVDIVLVNAAAGLIVGGHADGFSDGVEMAYEAIESGAAYTKLRNLVTGSAGDLSLLEEMETKFG